VRRRELWWADLPGPAGSSPGDRRPVVIAQSDAFTASRIATVIVVAITSRSRLAAAPGNVRLPRGTSGVARDSVINVTQMLAVDKDLLVERIGDLDARRLRELDDGLRLVLAL
jgi:mRNA interferase MazF